MNGVRATIAVLLLLGLAPIAAGCGSSSAATSGSKLGPGAASVVPADALAFVSVDTDLKSVQWRRIDSLTAGLPVRTKALDLVRRALAAKNLDLDRDVKPALGAELDVAVLGLDKGKPEAVALVRPSDEGKLRELASKLDRGAERYTVQRIGDWSVVASSQDAFARIRSVSSGRSLADVQAFRDASAQTGGDALATLYAAPRGKGVEWVAARLAADSDALRFRLAAKTTKAPVAYTPTLLGDVPSGASLAASFKGLGPMLARLKTGATLDAHAKRLGPLRQLLPSLRKLAPLLTGEGVLYVKQSGLLPEIGLEAQVADPERALAAARGALADLAVKLGPIPLTAQISGGKLVVADSPTVVGALRATGPKLVDDQSYRDALKAAGAPARTTGLLYADVRQLVPLLQIAGSALGKPIAADLATTLSRLGPLVVYGARDGTVSRVDAWARLNG